MNQSMAVAPLSSQDLVPSAGQLRTMLELADTLLKSGMLPKHIQTPQAAFAIIQKGKELGLPPMYALSNIVMISGKPTANAELMLAMVYRDQGDEAMRFVESTAERAVIAYKRRNWKQPETMAFTLEDAKRAGIIKPGPWQQYPAAMLRARCISAVARAAFADSIGGMYTPDEMGATVAMSSEGEITLQALPEPERAANPQEQYRPPASTAEPIPMRQISQTVTDEQTGEIVDVPAPPPVHEMDKPMGPKGYARLHGIASTLREMAKRIPIDDLDEHLTFPAGMTIGEGKTRLEFLQTLLKEAEVLAEESPL